MSHQPKCPIKKNHMGHHYFQESHQLMHPQSKKASPCWIRVEINNSGKILAHSLWEGHPLVKYIKYLHSQYIKMSSILSLRTLLIFLIFTLTSQLGCLKPEGLPSYFLMNILNPPWFVTALKKLLKENMRSNPTIKNLQPSLNMGLALGFT